MSAFDETIISTEIAHRYFDKLLSRITSDVLIAGAGPSGLLAAHLLAEEGYKVTVIEKRLSPGGGVWGGSMGMNEGAIQEEGIPLLEKLGVRYTSRGGDVATVDTVELASALSLRAIQSGAIVFNLTTVEDLCLREGRITGLVVNRSLIGDTLPVDPMALRARAVLDATGHEAVLVQKLRERGLLDDCGDECSRIEAPMDPPSGERFVVERVAEVYPGLWVSGMSVCATYGGPRMGPIFGGMLLSGQRVAESIRDHLSRGAEP